MLKLTLATYVLQYVVHTKLHIHSHSLNTFIADLYTTSDLAQALCKQDSLYIEYILCLGWYYHITWCQ